MCHEHTECPKMYRKSVLHLLKYRVTVYLNRCSADLRQILGHPLQCTFGKRVINSLTSPLKQPRVLSQEICSELSSTKNFQVRSARAVEDLQRKELEDQLEAEAYFSGLYKTQVMLLKVLGVYSSMNIQNTSMEGDECLGKKLKVQG